MLLFNKQRDIKSFPLAVSSPTLQAAHGIPAPQGSMHPPPMIGKAIDAASALFSLTFAVAAPLVDAQQVLPRGLFPAPLVRVRRWIVAEFDHYLLAQPPSFLRGLVWLALAFLWPVCVANLYAVATRRRRWLATTSLMAGVFMLTYTSAILGEVLGSGRATPKLVGFYAPLAMLAAAQVLRGLCLSAELPAAGTAAGLVEPPSAQKKRV